MGHLAVAALGDGVGGGAGPAGPAVDAVVGPAVHLALDDELIAKAQAFTGLKEKSSLVREALKALIERESARRLARLGGSEPDLVAAPRRRPE